MSETLIKFSRPIYANLIVIVAYFTAFYMLHYGFYKSYKELGVNALIHFNWILPYKTSVIGRLGCLNNIAADTPGPMSDELPDLVLIMNLTVLLKHLFSNQTALHLQRYGWLSLGPDAKNGVLLRVISLQHA
jgi:hypothetical protein